MGALRSTAELGGWENLFLLRRGVYAPGTAQPPGSPCPASTPGTGCAWSRPTPPPPGSLEVDRDYAANAAPGERLELHVLHPEWELRPAVLAGLERAFLFDRVPLLPAENQTTAPGDLTGAYPWLTEPSQVWGVDWTARAGVGRRPTRLALRRARPGGDVGAHGGLGRRAAGGGRVPGPPGRGVPRGRGAGGGAEAGLERGQRGGLDPRARVAGRRRAGGGPALRLRARPWWRPGTWPGPAWCPWPRPGCGPPRRRPPPCFTRMTARWFRPDMSASPRTACPGPRGACSAGAATGPTGRRSGGHGGSARVIVNGP